MSESNSPADSDAAPGPEPSQSDADAEQKLPIPAEVLEGLPEEKQRELTAIFTAMQYSGPFPNPIAAKLTAKHIDVILENQREATKLRYGQRKENGRITAAVFTLCSLLVVVVVLTLALTDHDATLQTLIPLGVAGAGGFGGGFGYAQWRKRDEED